MYIPVYKVYIYAHVFNVDEGYGLSAAVYLTRKLCGSGKNTHRYICEEQTSEPECAA